MSASSRRFPPWLAGLVVLALAIRLVRLGHQSLWIDELISLQLGTYATGAVFWRGLLTDIHGPFNSLLLHFWTRLGTGDAWLRLLYVIPGVLVVPVAWRLGAELFDEATGRMTAVAFAISPFHVWYSQEVRSYAWALLWITIVLLLYLRASDGTGGRGTWIGLGALCAISLLTNFATAFLLIGLTVAVLVRRPFSRALLARWAGVLAFSGIVFLPWFLDWYGRIGGERVFVDAPSPTGMPLRENAGFSWTEVPYAAWSFAYGYTLGPPLRALHLDRSWPALAPHFPVVVLGGMAIAVPVIAGIRATHERGRLGFLVAVVLMALALGILLATRGVKTFHPRYFIAVFPLFLALVSAGLVRARRLARGAGAVVAVLVAVSLGQMWFDPAYAKEDSRGAAGIVLANERPGDAVVVIYAFRPFRHYYADLGGGEAPLHHVHKRFLQTDDDLRAHVAESRRDAKRVWLVLSRWWDVAPEDRIRQAFEAQLDEQQRWEVPGVKVTLYEGRSG